MKVYAQFFNMSCGTWPEFKEESKRLIESSLLDAKPVSDIITI